MLKIERLIIIGAPSCAGKSYLIEKIQQGACPHLCAKLGITNTFSWRYVVARDLKHLRQQTIERLVVHYDLYAQYSHDNGFKHLEELILNSDRIIILTLMVEEKLLIIRTKLRLRKLMSDLIRSREMTRSVKILKRIIRLLKKRKFYKRGLSRFLYERWFDYLSQSHITTHCLLNSNESDVVIFYPSVDDKLLR
jgi:hypothetical protein